MPDTRKPPEPPRPWPKPGDPPAHTAPIPSTDLEVGDVVQLGPETNFPYCFMVVTDPKAWGAQGYIYMPQKLGEIPGEAYYRAKHEDMTYIGHAEWLPRPAAED